MIKAQQIDENQRRSDVPNFKPSNENHMSNNISNFEQYLIVIRFLHQRNNNSNVNVKFDD